MSSTAPTSYDEVPYPNYCFPQTHPDRLAVVATLLGLRPAPPQRCRVLELGCAAGGNLIPMADSLPQSTFLGIDLSGRQIDEGRRRIAELGLGNVELRRQSILDFDPGPETFDYIVCHGVYSWVPPEVQDRILALCAGHLRPEGVAYVSYNTLPGWHMRGMIRDMMCFHVRRLPRSNSSAASPTRTCSTNTSKSTTTRSTSTSSPSAPAPTACATWPTRPSAAWRPARCRRRSPRSFSGSPRT
jgi:SAM-dependent methyltransferase